MAERNEAQGGKAEDRRDSPRVPIRLKVRQAGGTEEWRERDGDLSLGGVAWNGDGLTAGTAVEVRFQLPGSPAEVEVRGEVLQVTQGPQGPAAHVRFQDLPVEAELAIARHLDNVRLAGGR